MENSQFVTDSELNSYINGSASELYDILISQYADYYYTKATQTISSGSTSFSVPSDFYKFRGLDYQVSSGEFLNVYKFNFEQRNSKNRELWRTLNRYAPYREYRLMGQECFIEPSDNAPGTYQLWYIPAYTELTADTDTLDTINHWFDYVVVDAAIKMLTKEESDTMGLMVQKQALLKRISEMAAERDVSEAETVADIYSSNEWNSDL
jgi:hypothetical protein